MNILEISKGITHFEDLPYSEIVNVLANLKDYQITEKVDGAQILFGIDSNGFYTSRESKGGTRIYNEGDYGITFPSTYMRSAHKLLEQMLPALKGAGMRPGDQVEAEVLYGQVPNVVPYSADTNYLIFLRTTEGTVNIDRLKQKLDGQAVSVSLVSPFTDNGKDIVLRESSNQWRFARVPIINKKHDAKIVSRHVVEMDRYLSTIDTFTMQPLRVILETPLNKTPIWVTTGTWKHAKEYIREKKEEIQLTLSQSHILPIKEILLGDLVRETASSFGPSLEEGGWIEGVVLKHKDTGKMFKLVDKQVFGTIREHAWAKRNMLTEVAKSINSANSFMGKLYLDMAVSLGHPELGTIQAKRYLQKSGALNENILNILSTNLNFEGIKHHWLSLLEVKELELERELDKYCRESHPLLKENSFLNTAVKKRTLETFAISFDKIQNYRVLTEQSRTVSDLLSILVKRHLGNLT